MATMRFDFKMGRYVLRLNLQVHDLPRKGDCVSAQIVSAQVMHPNDQEMMELPYVKVVHERENAYCLRLHTGDSSWFPKSNTTIDPEAMTFTAPLWLLRKKGLVAVTASTVAVIPAEGELS